MKDFSKKDVEHNGAESVLISDKLFVFWLEQRSKIVRGAMIVVLVVVMALGLEWHKDYMDEQCRDAYSMADTLDKKLIFADNYSDKPLAGVVWLEAADRAYQEKDYAKAQEYYEKAKVPLAHTMIGTRPLMGEAMAAIKQADIDKGGSLLRKIASDTSVADTFRAEAAYTLALLSIGAKQEEDARVWVELVNSLPYAGIWKYKAELLAL